MWEDFKKFAIKGNVVDLAIGVVIGGAFGKIVTSLVNDIIMPIIGLLLGGINFSGLQFQIGSASVRYGSFIQNILDFLIVAYSIFMFIWLISKLKKKEKDEHISTPSREEVLLTEIRDLLKGR
ncbi:MAG: large conductance mechanosensitive channel protein MscL [Peptococcaceae bacterium]|nr:large conductance mechanosensitive channel protein MscL [Peptococcaceae bacterium]